MDDRLSVITSLDHNSPCHNVIHCPVVLEEEKRDEDRKEEGDGEVLVQRSHHGSVKVKAEDNTGDKWNSQRWEKRGLGWITHAEKETLDAGATSTRLGWTTADVLHVTTRKPSRNFPGVAPPAPQIQMV